MNNISLVPGRYVIAVSGGVDSMCLLHCLKDMPGIELVVAHFNHQQRPDAYLDAELVAATAQAYNLPYVGGSAKAGIKSDENSLRVARYDFLETVRQQSDAQAIVTAHHQDDLLETILLQMLRGTNRKGLSPLRRTGTMRRPLLGVSKVQLYDYAHQQQLAWREDSSNNDLAYRRNYVRHQLMPRLSAEQRQRLLSIEVTMGTVNTEIDDLMLSIVSACVPRSLFINLPHAVSREYLAVWLRQQGIADFDRQQLNRLVVAAKTLPAGRSVDIRAGYKLLIKRQSLALETPERYNKETYG